MTRKALPTFYTVEEAAPLLRMGRSTLYRAIRAGKVAYHVMPTGVIRFTDEDIEETLEWSARPIARIKPASRAA